MILECKPSAKIPSLYSINNHQIPNYFEEIRTFVANELANCCRVAITCDGWQSKSNDSYLGSTGHAITNDWKYINYTLGLRYLESAHTAVNLTAELRTIFQDWKIENKVVNQLFLIINTEL